MATFMPHVDVCIANEEDAEKVFGIRAAGSDITGGVLSHEGYKAVAGQLKERFGFQAVAITLRGSISASDNNWAAMLYKDGEYSFLAELPHPYRGPGGRRRRLCGRPYLRVPQRLQRQGCPGIRGGGVLSQTFHRGRREPRDSRRGKNPHGRRGFGARPAIRPVFPLTLLVMPGK